MAKSQVCVKFVQIQREAATTVLPVKSQRIAMIQSGRSCHVNQNPKQKVPLPRGALSVGVFYESTPELMDCRMTKFKDLYCAKYGSEGKKLFIKKYSVEKWSGSIISFFEPSETIEIWLLQNGNYGLVMVSQYEKKNFNLSSS